jgi:hypothetical protein
LYKGVSLWYLHRCILGLQSNSLHLFYSFLALPPSPILTVFSGFHYAISKHVLLLYIITTSYIYYYVFIQVYIEVHIHILHTHYPWGFIFVNVFKNNICLCFLKVLQIWLCLIHRTSSFVHFHLVHSLQSMGFSFFFLNYTYNFINCCCKIYSEPSSIHLAVKNGLCANRNCKEL